jgi:septal ring factor EnvC (AmiA/AmiB activator)
MFVSSPPPIFFLHQVRVVFEIFSLWLNSFFVCRVFTPSQLDELGKELQYFSNKKRQIEKELEEKSMARGHKELKMEQYEADLQHEETEVRQTELLHGNRLASKDSLQTLHARLKQINEGLEGCKRRHNNKSFVQITQEFNQVRIT